MELPSDKWDLIVSTHSRLKAAGPTGETTEILKNGFNTQPPEGGWMREDKIVIVKIRFNTQPPEGGWYISKHINSRLPVSTHSRLKAAGRIRCNMGYQVGRFNTQPPEGGWVPLPHSKTAKKKFQHTAARRRLVLNSITFNQTKQFQHTAARRRLAVSSTGGREWEGVSTHSRPKAAGNRHGADGWRRAVSTHSRPKAAGNPLCSPMLMRSSFNTQPPEGGWAET